MSRRRSSKRRSEERNDFPQLRGSREYKFTGEDMVSALVKGEAEARRRGKVKGERKQRLNELPNINWDETILAGVPSFRVTDVLGNETALQQFKDTMERFVEQLRAGVSGPSRA